MYTEAFWRVLEARYPAWMAWPGVGSLQLSYIVIHILHMWLSWEGFSGVFGAPI